MGQAVKAFIKVSSTDKWLSGESSTSVNLTAEAQEITDKSSEWAQFISGKKGATIEVTLFADDDDDAQAAAIAALIAGDEVDFAIGATTSTTNAPTGGYSGKGIVTAVSDTYDTGSVSSRSISITATGEVTFTA